MFSTPNIVNITFNLQGTTEYCFTETEKHQKGNNEGKRNINDYWRSMLLKLYDLSRFQ